MSKKSELRKRAHAGKKKFPTQAAADAAILSWEHAGLHGLHSYKCPFGKHWHAGHKNKKKNRSANVKPKEAPGTNSEAQSSGACDSDNSA